MKKILVIDDDLHVRTILARKLGSKQVEVITAADGLAGLELALRQKPDLAIIDVVMPKMTGYDLCKKLRESAETRDMPVIVLSGQGDIDNHFKSLQCGANDFVVKPIDFDLLKEKIRKAAPLLLDSTPG